MHIDNAKKIIIDGIKITGGKRGGIYIGENTEDIRIINCDISGWGRTGTIGTYEGSFGEAYGYLDESGNVINYDAGIRLANSTRTTIEGCFIHDPAGDTTPWESVSAQSGAEDIPWRNNNNIVWNKNSDGIKISHPAGMCGIYAQTKNSVIRYNDIVGNENHRFNDGIESKGNFDANGGLAADCDVYGNFIAFGQDDGTELDGGAANVRYYGNRITNFYSGISTAANMTGPSFVFNNVIDNLRDGTNTPNLHMKNGSTDTVGLGVTHIFYNTFYADAGRRDYGIAELGYYNAVSRNNVIVGGQSSRPQVAMRADGDGFVSKSSMNYDLLGNHGTADKKGSVSVLAGTGREENAILGMPTFENVAEGLFKLTPSSLGYTAPTTVKGFSGASMGAVDRTSSGLIPIRPVKATSDKYTMSISNGGSGQFVISSTSSQSMPFTIETNDKNGALTVSPSTGSLAAGGSVTVTVSANFEPAEAGNNGVVFVRFADGLSIPVLVKITD